MSATKPKMIPGVIYSGDNGRLQCTHCASWSAQVSLRESNGIKVVPLGVADNKEWMKHFGRPLACECGKTKYLKPL